MIYLASSSPRRKKILRELSIPFKVLKPSYPENPIPDVSPVMLVRIHAIEKALSCLKLVKTGTILAADTIVYFQHCVIGKPKNKKNAVQILSALQGQWHTVYTGVALLNVKQGKIQSKKIFVDKTDVKIKKMSTAEINAYFRRINPLDKAGAYAIQSKINIVESLHGSFSNAVGLPKEKLIKFLSDRSR